jgi:hypothetical protein
MCNYKEKTLYHIKNKLNKKFIVREVQGKRHSLELIFFEDPIAIFPNWENCYKYLKLFTKSQKRKWLEKSKNFQNYIWDTDLETFEQEIIKDIQEIYDYKYSSLDISELSEILSDLTDEELKKSIKNLVYALEYIYKKETIEIE